MPFDPFSNKPQHTKAELDALFKGSSVTLQRLFVENRQLYDQCRAEYQQYNGIGDAPYLTEPERAALQKAPAQRNLSEAELRAAAKHSAEDCKAFFARDPKEPSSLPIPSKLKDEDPEAYAEWQLAGRVHGIFDRATAIVSDNSFKPAAPKRDDGETLMDLGSPYVEFFHLPADTKVTLAEFNRMATIKMDADNQRLEKIAADAAAIAQKYQASKPNGNDDGSDGGAAPAAVVAEKS